MLTTSQRDYAEKINEAFGLGFEELYCREDIFVFRPFADLKAEAVAPQSVLIDDLSPTETLARLKMKFLVHRLAYNDDIVAFKMGRRQGARRAHV